MRHVSLICFFFVTRIGHGYMVIVNFICFNYVFISQFLYNKVDEPKVEPIINIYKRTGLVLFLNDLRLV